jgi:cell division protein FtsL
VSTIGQKRTFHAEQIDAWRRREMAGPTMSNEKYKSLTKGQRTAYWAIVAVVAAVIAYMLFFYRQ